MTPEEKARRYDEALKRAKDILFGSTDTSQSVTKEMIEGIFPELKESEDEKMRKILIDYFLRYKKQEEFGVKTFYGIPTSSILAWLEKQKPGEWSEDDEIIFNVTTSFLSEYAAKGYENAVMCIDWLKSLKERMK